MSVFVMSFLASLLAGFLLMFMVPILDFLISILQCLRNWLIRQGWRQGMRLR